MIALFPGQGSQNIGMGKSLCDEFPVAKRTFEEASDAIHVDIKKLCFDGPESELTLTENLQPALLTVSIAALRVLEEKIGLKPSSVAGHSLGEYSALVAAKAVTLQNAITWVRARGSAMQTAVPVGIGGMMAVLGLDDQIVNDLCDEANSALSASNLDGFCAPANYNSPGQIVISGTIGALDRCKTLVSGSEKYKKGKLISLPVSAPFHCKLMEPARKKMAELFTALGSDDQPKPLNCKYIPNRTARLSGESSIILDMLIEQIDHPVLWKQTMDGFLDAGNERFIEIGPGNVLAGLVKRCARAKEVKAQAFTFSKMEELSGIEKEINSNG